MTENKVNMQELLVIIQFLHRNVVTNGGVVGLAGPEMNTLRRQQYDWTNKMVIVIYMYIYVYTCIYIYMSPVPGPPHPPLPPQWYPPPLLTPANPPKPSICMLFAHIHTHIYSPFHPSKLASLRYLQHLRATTSSTDLVYLYISIITFFSNRL